VQLILAFIKIPTQVNKLISIKDLKTKETHVT